jgi:hypothetical protein
VCDRGEKGGEGAEPAKETVTKEPSTRSTQELLVPVAHNELANFGGMESSPLLSDYIPRITPHTLDGDS